MTIQLIAIDIDGTLINRNHQISEQNKKAIQAAYQKGIKIILTSGRPYLGILPFLKTLDLQQKDLFAISNNGALIHQAKTGQILHESLMSHEDYLQFAQFAKNHNVAFHSIAKDRIYTSNQAISPYTVHESFLTNTPLFYRSENEVDKNLAYSKIMFCDEKDVLDRIQTHLSEIFNARFNLYRSADFFIECLSKNASKGLAVHYVADHNQIAPENVMVIGDQSNDLSMFSFAGHKIAMGNAIEELKEQATFVTKTNNENGVAVALEKFVL